MPEKAPEIIEPRRPADVARMDISMIRLEAGVRLDDVFSRVTELAACTLDVERVGVWLLSNQKTALRCADLFEKSKSSHSSGTTLLVEDFPDYFAALERRKTVAAEVANVDPRTSGLTEAYLVPLGITSILDAAIFVGGEIVGVVCHEHIGPEREWTTEARDFASSMADLVALKMRSAEVEDLRSVLKTQSAQIAEAKRLESLALMAAGAAHDFNNVLTVISNYAELISMDKSTPAEPASFAQAIVKATAQGANLVAELMAFAKPSHKFTRVLRPSEILRDQLTFLQTAAGEHHQVELEIHTDFAGILIDPDQLQRLVANLTINARDAMPDGGVIKITLSIVEASDAYSKAANFAMIAVADQGTGIPEHLLAKIFDPFFTTKPKDKGTGLGLALVEQAVRQTGGFIRVESTVGKGTTFRIYLPLVSK